MSRINRVPFGLQELLGSTAQGDNPSDLLQDVRASFDIEPLWHADRIESIEGTGTQQTIGAGIQVTIPSGEYWRPIVFSCIQNIAIGDSTGIVLTMTLLPQSEILFFENSGIHTPIQTENVVVSHSFPTSVLYRPGTSFGVQLIGTNTPAGRVLTLNVMFLRYLM